MNHITPSIRAQATTAQLDLSPEDLCCGRVELAVPSNFSGTTGVGVLLHQFRQINLIPASVGLNIEAVDAVLVIRLNLLPPPIVRAFYWGALC